MKIRVDDDRTLVLEEMYSGVVLRTSEGNEIGICMRDDTFEINVMPGGRHTQNWWRVNMQDGTIVSMSSRPCATDPANSPAGRDRKASV